MKLAHKVVAVSAKEAANRYKRWQTGKNGREVVYPYLRRRTESISIGTSSS